MNILNWFRKKEEVKEVKPKIVRTVRDLLRENLKTVAVDVFYIEDPITSLNPEDRKMYLQYFYELSLDKKLIERVKYLINRQANKTLKSSDGGTFDIAGAMNINGLALVKDDIERLGSAYLKENAQKQSPFNKMGI